MTDTAASSLVVRLMAASARDTAHITNQLLETVAAQLADRDAELAAIRTRINELFYRSDYMPSQTAIIDAVFYPDADLIAHLREPSLTERAEAEQATRAGEDPS